MPRLAKKLKYQREAKIRRREESYGLISQHVPSTTLPTDSKSNSSAASAQTAIDSKSSSNSLSNVFTVPSLKAMTTAFIAETIGSKELISRITSRNHKSNHPLLLKHNNIFRGKQGNPLFNNVVLMHLILIDQNDNKSKVEDILQGSPQLMFEEASIKIKLNLATSVTIYGSPYKAVLGADDDEMLEMMKPYIEKFDPDKSIARKQFCEQFPEDTSELSPPTKDTKSEASHIQSHYDFSYLIDAIGNEKLDHGNLNTNTKNALSQFLRDFSPPLIKSGYHFDLLAFINSLKKYQNLTSTWNLNQLGLYWDKVIRHFLSILPVNFQQRFKNVVTFLKQKPLKSRQLNYRGFWIFRQRDMFTYCDNVIDELETLHKRKMEKRNQFKEWLKQPSLVPSTASSDSVYGELAAAPLNTTAAGVTLATPDHKSETPHQAINMFAVQRAQGLAAPLSDQKQEVVQVEDGNGYFEPLTVTHDELAYSRAYPYK